MSLNISQDAFSIRAEHFRPGEEGLLVLSLNNRKGQIVRAPIGYLAPPDIRSSYPHSRDSERPRESSKRRRRGQSDNGVGGRGSGEGRVPRRGQ